jgi:valyl-tRNA synthetase
MPFLTEEIWQRIPHRGESIMTAEWPAPDPARSDPQARASMQTLIALITKLRNIRSEMNIPNQSRLTLYLGTANEAARSLISENSDHIKRLARVEQITVLDELPRLASAATDIVSGIEVGVPLEGLIDVARERERVSKELARKGDEAAGLKSRLDNPSFVERAPSDVVEQSRARFEELMTEIEKLRNTVELLGAK